MIKFILTIIGLNQMTVLASDINSDFQELHDSITQSQNISEQNKIGLDHIAYWAELNNKYPQKEAEIPELEDQINQIVAGSKAQILKCYQGNDRDILTGQIDTLHTQWTTDLKGKSPTRKQWYQFCLELSCACQLGSPPSPLQEIVTRCEQLGEMSIIVGIVFPTTQTPEFDGQLGKAAIVAGLLNNVWLAGFSVRNDLLEGNQKISPQYFMWYQIYADSFNFMILYKGLNHSIKRQKLIRFLKDNPSDINYSNYFTKLLKSFLVFKAKII